MNKIGLIICFEHNVVFVHIPLQRYNIYFKRANLFAFFCKILKILAHFRKKS